MGSENVNTDFANSVQFHNILHPHLNSSTIAAPNSLRNHIQVPYSNQINIKQADHYQKNFSVEKELSYTCDKVMTSEIMLNFLQHKTYNSVSVNTPRAALKPYGCDKRLLCPPPAIVYDLKEYSRIRNKERTDSENTEEQSDGNKVLGAAFIKQLPENTITVQSTSLADVLTFNKLYPSDSDHVKDLKVVQLKLVYNEIHDLGSYFSTDIKVISKPSKKKQTQNSNDLCIESGSKIALFNRLRSQTVMNTRYLVADQQQMNVKASSSGEFSIFIW